MIAKATWVLAKPRTGSFWLCEMLNATGAFRPYISEWHNDHFRNKPAGFPLVRHCKIHPDQYEAANFDLPMLAEKYDGLRFIVLRRRDHIAVATSEYIATSTGTWRITSQDQMETWLSKSIRIDDARLLNLYQQTKNNDCYWNDELNGRGLSERVVAEIIYEDLLADPSSVMSSLLAALNVHLDKARIRSLFQVKIRKQQRPEYQAIYHRLQQVIGAMS